MAAKEPALVKRWHGLEARWKKARKTKRVSTSIACAAAYGFWASVSGKSGGIITVGCALFIGGGLAIPIKGQRANELLSLGLAALLFAAGIVAYLDPLANVSQSNVTRDASLTFNLSDEGSDESDASVAYLKAVSSPPRSTFPLGGIKAGVSSLKLTISNSFARSVIVSDIQVVDLKIRPPVAGDLFYSIAQGEAPNDLLGVDMSSRHPVLRQVTSAGELAEPFFGNSHIVIAAHSSEIISLTILAGGPQLYSWKFKIYYDADDGTRTSLVRSPISLLRLTGYVHSYRKVDQAAGQSGWKSSTGDNFCSSVGTQC